MISTDYTADSVEGFIPLTVHFTYTGSGATQFLWDFGDGTSTSEGKCADGTYFYVLDAVGYDKKEYHMQGTISLLR